MTYDQVIRHYGNGTNTAKALGINSSAIYQWGRKGIVPFDKQYRIEVLTSGALKAERLPVKDIAAERQNCE